MTQPAAPSAPAAPAPAPATPAPAPAAAATEAAAVAPAPAAKSHAQKRLQAFVTQKTYGTKVAAKAPMPTTPKPQTEITNPAALLSASESAASAKPPEGTPPSSPAQAVDSAAAKPVEPAKTEAPAEKPQEPALTDAEFSKRMAKLTRASERLAQERQSFANERQQTQLVAQRLQLVEQAVSAAKQNPLGLLAQLGVPTQAVLDAIISDGAKPEATKVEEARAREAEAFAKRVADLEKQVKDAHEAQARDKWNADAAEYQRAAILPMLKDAGETKYQLTLRALGSTEAAAAEIFALQQKRYQVTLAEVRAGTRERPEVLSPEQAAQRIEDLLRSQLTKLSGTSAKPQEPQANPTRSEPAIAKPNGSPTHQTAAPKGQFVTARKPYSTRDKGAA